VGERDVTGVTGGNGKREAGSGMPASRRPIQHYRDIDAYQRALRLLAPVHALARKLPKEEQYELASQIRRASKSIVANIAEGYGGKRSPAKFKAALSIALGSANEMVVHLEVGVAIGYFTTEEAQPLMEEYQVVAKQLYRLMENWQDYSRRGKDGSGERSA
jgi:four helix bundle protein